MWFEQDAATAHLEQVRTDLVHDIAAGLVAGQPTFAHRPRRAATPGRLRRSLSLHRHQVSLACAHAMAHAGSRA